MAYGKFSPAIVNNYNLVDYTVGGTKYANISIFKTTPATMSVAPAYYLKGNKKLMENLHPEGVLADKLVAKCTASPMTYGQTGDTSYGLYYTVGGTLFYSGKQLPTPGSYTPDTQGHDWPAFCVKKDGSAIIRWFDNSSALTTALPYCSAIIAAGNPLVYGGQSVFESIIKSTADAMLKIYDPNEKDSSKQHFNNNICTPILSPAYRVFFGHKSDGSYFLVCLDRCTMDMRVGAKLMCDLGCDYAVNEDGGQAVQMRVATGYTGSKYQPGQMTSGGTDYYGACICAYLK